MSSFSLTTWDTDWLGEAVGFMGTESTCCCETGYAGNPDTEPNVLLLVPSYPQILPLLNCALWWTDGTPLDLNWCIMLAWHSQTIVTP